MSATVVSPVFVGRQDEIVALTALLDRVSAASPRSRSSGARPGWGRPG